MRLKLLFRRPSNAWPDRHPHDDGGMWQAKEPYSHEVQDSLGNRLLVWRFPRAGGIIRPHVHDYDHDSTLVQGTVIVTGDAEGRDGIPITAPDTLFFKAGTEHSIKALTGKVILVHSYKSNTNITDVS